MIRLRLKDCMSVTVLEDVGGNNLHNKSGDFVCLPKFTIMSKCACNVSKYNNFFYSACLLWIDYRYCRLLLTCFVALDEYKYE